MTKTLIYALGTFYLASAAYMWVWPEQWYVSVPGVQMMGPFNLHFIRDVALMFLMSAAALGWAAAKADVSAGVCGAAWPCLHALFHIWIWGARGFPLDVIALTNLLGIQLPAWLALWAVLRLRAERAAG